MKFPFGRKREPATLRERLLDAIDRVDVAEKIYFVPLGEGFSVFVVPPVYDLAGERERFNRDSEDARREVMGDAPLGRYTIINFRDVRDGHLPYSDDYQLWAGKHAIKLTGEIGLFFMVMEEQVRQVIAQECEQAGLSCAPHGEWNMIVQGAPSTHTIHTGDLVYEAIGRAENLSELVRQRLSRLNH